MDKSFEWVLQNEGYTCGNKYFESSNSFFIRENCTKYDTTYVESIKNDTKELIYKTEINSKDFEIKQGYKG